MANKEVRQSAEEVEEASLNFSKEEKERLRLFQNPYYKLSVGPDSAQQTMAAEPVPAASLSKATVSKEDFESEARRILGFYIPAVEKNGRLRPHHKAFVDRNKVLSPEHRYKVLKQLRKYDLSDLVGIQGRFNREREDLTDAKLRQIEHDALLDK